jgi:hypothetical protein
VHPDEILPGLRRHRVAARTQKQPSAEPLLEQAYLPADRTMADVELFGRTAEAAEPRRGLESLDRIQRRQAGAHHAMIFSHIAASEQVVCHQTVTM